MLNTHRADKYRIFAGPVRTATVPTLKRCESARMEEVMRMKKIHFGVSAVALAATIIAACGGGGGNDSFDVVQGVVIQNASIVNTRDGSILAATSVVLDGGKITRITPAHANVGGTAIAVDGSGKFLIPGLLDMHTHYFDNPTDQPQTAALLVANGITNIREMRGSSDLVQAAAQQNAARAAGTLDVPEILVIPGDPIGLTAIAASTSAAAAIQEVDKQKAYGAGFIKSFRANRDATLAFLAEAKSQGMYVAGHLSQSVSAKESVAAGWKAIEHLGAGLTILLDCSANEDSIRAAVVAAGNNNPFYQPILDSYSDPKCQALAQTFATSGTWHTPTLLKLRTGLVANDPAYLNDPNLIYVPKATRAAWAGAAQAFTASNDATLMATKLAYFNKEQTLPKLLKQNGVRLMAGSDTSSVPNWVIAGFSLHQEYKMLAAGGLSPLDILQMTTLAGAQFMNRESTMGTVEEGKNADLVLLDANPIADVANLDKISAVFLRGKYLSKTALDKMKADVAAFYASQTAQQAAHALSAAAVPAHDD
jgi:imidazolonepropionase-like amidohydrolase